MFGIFGKQKDPVWEKVKRIDAADRLDICAVVVMSGAIRQGAADHLVSPLEKICAIPSIQALCKSTHPIVPFSPQVRERLVDEAVTACLVCTASDRISANTFRVITPHQFIGILGMVVLESINSRMQREDFVPPAEMGYSSDPDEARTQLLLRWLDIAGVKELGLVGTLASAGFKDAWESFASRFIPGTLIGVARANPDQLLSKASELCAQLPPRSRGIVDHWADQALARQKRIRAMDRMTKEALAQIVLHDTSASVRREALRKMGIDVEETLQRLEAEIRAGGKQDIVYLGLIMMAGRFCQPILERLAQDPEQAVSQLAQSLLNHANKNFWVPPFLPPSEP
jgi:hypothetical protein